MDDQEEIEEETEQEATKEVAGQPKKKVKKVVRRRKTKKDRENPLTVAIRLAVESGKVDFGARTGIMASLLGKAKLFVLSGNTPIDVKSKVERFSTASNIPFITFEGSSMELGSVCGKPFPVSVLSIYEEGTSNIMKLVKK
ncbi:50S ribosomal protein L30e [Candidatus Micrarchaeota archaeon]|nr:50S ribosomal protein L30e [Candidatus Micrarchaeota archaeon]MBU1165810.1 50S ribosomal protein L30e [Candidatus Micrarchaeota archaeon]MBU1887505.1 50S ribosomal protein L30e [Candidatus Micrarchaeota archaeon]